MKKVIANAFKAQSKTSEICLEKSDFWYVE